jgi:hypothetical protein
VRAVLVFPSCEGCVGFSFVWGLCWCFLRVRAVLVFPSCEGCVGFSFVWGLCWRFLRVRAVLVFPSCEGCVGVSFVWGLCWFPQFAATVWITLFYRLLQCWSCCFLFFNLCGWFFGLLVVNYFFLVWGFFCLSIFLSLFLLLGQLELLDFECDVISYSSILNLWICILMALNSRVYLWFRLLFFLLLLIFSVLLLFFFLLHCIVHLKEPVCFQVRWNSKRIR